MQTIVNVIVNVVVALALLGLVFVTGCQEGESRAERVAADRIRVAQAQADEWKGKANAAQKRYDEQAPKLAKLTATNADLVGQLQRQPPDTRGASCEAVGQAYQGAERDIGRCAAHVDRFSREAADASRSHRALDEAYPEQRGTGRKATRAAREAARKN